MSIWVQRRREAAPRNSSMDRVILELRNVRGGYDRRAVLRDISFKVSEGELIGIIGPNGHGKSTLLRAISALLPWREGEIFLGGADIARLPPHDVVGAGLVHVLQGDLLFPQMNVEENLVMGAFLRPKAEIPGALEGIYVLFPHLAERRHQVAMSLSGGERRMVGIGRGLMSGGRLLMLDEPSLGLAPRIIDHIYAVLRQLKRESRSILLVEENPSRIFDIADHILLIDDGAIAWSGQAEELKENPALLRTYLGGEPG